MPGPYPEIPATRNQEIPGSCSFPAPPRAASLPGPPLPFESPQTPPGAAYPETANYPASCKAPPASPLLPNSSKATAKPASPASTPHPYPFSPVHVAQPSPPQSRALFETIPVYPELRRGCALSFLLSDLSVLGGGFAGLVAAQTLKRADVEITLLDKRNFHLFQPLLYQVATGSLSPAEIAAPIRAVLSHQKNVEVLLGEAVDIDPQAKKVLLADGDSFPYDTLIIATGSQTSYYGNDQWRENAPSLKSVEEATRMRHNLLYAFERAERAETEAEERAWLTFVIVGD